MAEQWLIHSHGQQYGPVDTATVRVWLAQGRVTDNDLVWRERRNEWLRIASIAAFAGVAPAATVTLPPPMPFVPYESVARPRAWSPMEKAILPVGRSGYAIAAGYLALFSILLVPAPFALGAGIGALTHLNKHPHLGGRGRAWFGIVVGGVVTVAMAFAILRRH